MHKRDYFLAALRAESYRWKKWVIGCFSLTMTVSGDEPRVEFPYQLFHNENGFYFHDPDNNHAITWLEGAEPNEAPFHFKQEIVLGVGEIPNLKKGITSTYGNLLFNQLVLCYAFGDKIEYLEGPISVSKVESIIEGRLQDDPPEGTDRDPKAIYVSEYKKFNEAIFSLAGYTQLCVPSATPRTMTTDPKIKERRAELLEQYKDRLHDPVVQAMIDKELIAMDRAWIDGDPNKGFYYRNKSFDVVRKKVFLTQGAEQGFGVQGKFIPNSLEDGWDIKHLPAMSNSLRDGSFNRGSQTMLGGEATKFNYRIFQNTSVTEDDCGSRLGLQVSLSKDNVKHFVSNFALTAKGDVEITKENAESFIGKTVRVRSPIYCKTSGANFCAKCMGRKISATPRAIPTYAADIGSMFLGIFMKAMHGKALVTAEWDPATAIR
jgi:hypothetical protein